MRWTTGSHSQVTFPLVLYTASSERRVEETGDSKGSGFIEPVDLKKISCLTVLGLGEELTGEWGKCQCTWTLLQGWRGRQGQLRGISLVTCFWRAVWSSGGLWAGQELDSACFIYSFMFWGAGNWTPGIENIPKVLFLIIHLYELSSCSASHLWWSFSAKFHQASKTRVKWACSHCFTESNKEQNYLSHFGDLLKP